MKELTLIRHAKSSWDHPHLSDHERPLNGRGERAAPRVGAALAERGFRPEVMISSTAVRAYTTATIIAGEIGYAEAEIVRDESVYHAGTPTLLRVVQGIDESHQSAVLFGHNPGFHDLANTLLGDGAAIGRLVTCAVVRMRLAIEHWGIAGPGDGELIEHLWPRMLESEG